VSVLGKYRGRPSSLTPKWPLDPAKILIIFFAGLFGIPMKLVAEYLADALKFERLASHEKNPDVKAQLEKQAAAYRRLAEKRADE